MTQPEQFVSLRNDPLVPVIAATLDKVTRILGTRDHTCDVLRAAYQQLDTQTRDNALGMVARDVRRAMGGEPEPVRPTFRIRKATPTDETQMQVARERVADAMRRKIAKEIADEVFEEEPVSATPIPIPPAMFVELTEKAYENLGLLIAATSFTKDEIVSHAVTFLWEAIKAKADADEQAAELGG